MPDWPPQPPALPTLAISQGDALTALRAFLTGVVAPTTAVVRAQVNRVPEPEGSDFVVMTPISQKRLETNETTYLDNILVGSIAGTTLTVSSVTRGSIQAGALLTDTVWPTMNVAANTIVGAQLTGTPGGAGTYAVTPSQTLASETLYAGVRADLVATELVVQLDVHGPASADNVRVIDTLFRSEYGVDAFATSGLEIRPLYADDARQVPFINAEQQYEDRWTIDVHMQANPVVRTPQLFADEIVVQTIEVDAFCKVFQVLEDGKTINVTEDGRLLVLENCRDANFKFVVFQITEDIGEAFQVLEDGATFSITEDGRRLVLESSGIVRAMITEDGRRMILE